MNNDQDSKLHTTDSNQMQCLDRISWRVLLVLQELGVPLEPLVWNRVVPGLSRLEGLYLEFIEVHTEVLQCMTQLAKLR